MNTDIYREHYVRTYITVWTTPAAAAETRRNSVSSTTKHYYYYYYYLASKLKDEFSLRRQTSDKTNSNCTKQRPKRCQQTRCLRVVSIRTLSMGNVFFGKAVFIGHPYLLQRVLGEFTRVRRGFVLHRPVRRWGGRSGDADTGELPVMLLWRRWPVFHPRGSSGQMEMTCDASSRSLCTLCGVTCSLLGATSKTDRNDCSSSATQILLNRKLCIMCACLK